MKIDLNNIFNNDGEIINIDHAVDLSGFELNGVFPIQKPVKVVGKISNTAGLVTIDASAEYVYSAPCDRCAAETVREMKTAVRHTLVAELNDEENDELMLIENMVLDLDELVFTDILLELPSKYLCSENCRGLCVQCGKNLNDGPCGCKKAIDPRWSELAKLLDD